MRVNVSLEGVAGELADDLAPRTRDRADHRRHRSAGEYAAHGLPHFVQNRRALPERHVVIVENLNDILALNHLVQSRQVVSGQACIGVCQGNVSHVIPVEGIRGVYRDIEEPREAVAAGSQVSPGRGVKANVVVGGFVNAEASDIEPADQHVGCRARVALAED